MNTPTQTTEELMTSIQNGIVFAEVEYPANTKYVSYNDDRVASVTTTENNDVVIMTHDGMFVNEVAVDEDDHESILRVLSDNGYFPTEDGLLSDVNNLITFGGLNSDTNIFTVGERGIEHSKTTGLITIRGHECTNTYTLTKDLTRRELWAKVAFWIKDINPTVK
ncbi:hypothetical protein TSMG0161 [Halocynthia phage JM-2012]|uniref:hypothetical protein n=1 Tax=Halocynthia phage JM-2012 TaxID=1173297 RepID=UPI00025C697D|nr:hypothetical protein TSMG0161 [Halocynthia phage JM-2012]AFI55444.1 hypothetical protein TSMG0161 [Halocynthia phage JM-2012]